MDQIKGIERERSRLCQLILFNTKIASLTSTEFQNISTGLKPITQQAFESCTKCIKHISKSITNNKLTNNTINKLLETVKHIKYPIETINDNKTTIPKNILLDCDRDIFLLIGNFLYLDETIVLGKCNRYLYIETQTKYYFQSRNEALYLDKDSIKYIIDNNIDLFRYSHCFAFELEYKFAGCGRGPQWPCSLLSMIKQSENLNYHTNWFNIMLSKIQEFRICQNPLFREYCIFNHISFESLFNSMSNTNLDFISSFSDKELYPSTIGSFMRNFQRFSDRIHDINNDKKHQQQQQSEQEKKEDKCDIGIGIGIGIRRFGFINTHLTLHNALTLEQNYTGLKFKWEHECTMSMNDFNNVFHSKLKELSIQFLPHGYYKRNQRKLKLLKEHNWDVLNLNETKQHLEPESPRWIISDSKENAAVDVNLNYEKERNKLNIEHLRLVSNMVCGDETNIDSTVFAPVDERLKSLICEKNDKIFLNCATSVKHFGLELVLVDPLKQYNGFGGFGVSNRNNNNNNNSARNQSLTGVFNNFASDVLVKMILEKWNLLESLTLIVSQAPRGRHRETEHADMKPVIQMTYDVIMDKILQYVVQHKKLKQMVVTFSRPNKEKQPATDKYSKEMVFDQLNENSIQTSRNMAVKHANFLLTNMKSKQITHTFNLTQQ